MTAVTLERLTKRYEGSTEAVKAMDLEVPNGELVAFLGPSGCGKTTTLKMIAGLIQPTSGDVRFDGTSIVDVPAHLRGVAMVFQKPLLFPYMTVGDNVAFGLRMRSQPQVEIVRRVREMLELVRLPGFEGRMPRQLSGGQEQRISLARALIIQPNVLLLDEPLSQLDANLRIEMRELIVRIQRQLGITTIFVTHDQEEAVMLADRIALIFEGQLQQYDTPRGFYEHPKDARVARFFGGTNFVGGTKAGGRVWTALGDFAVTQHGHLPDGAVQMTIRPEAVVLGGPDGANTTHGIVQSAIYMGTHIRYLIGAEDAVIHAIADAGTQYTAGSRLAVTFPEERIWLVPAEARA
jgi:ABC-type Fe3+/spermidine/putrescine transport system ATPase subunit